MKKNILFITCALFAIQPIFSQTGPGGVGNSSNNVFWLDASTLGLNNNDAVSTWTDMSGNGNDLVQAASGRQPVFKTSQVNALPSVDFFSDYMESSAIADLNTTDFSQFIVAKADNNTHVGFLLHNNYTSGASTESDQYWGMYLTTVGNQYRTFTRDNTGVARTNDLGYQTGYNIMSSVISSASSDITGYFNNNSLGTVAGYNSTPAGHVRSVLGKNAAGTKQFFLGNMAEIIVYNTALNSAEHNIVNNYLAAKYRRTITNDLFNHELTHHDEVFGIGQEADGANTTAQGSGIVEFSNPTLVDGDYIIAGHDDVDLSLTNNDVPAAIAPASRLQRLWRVTTTGTPGTLTISFDISGTAYAAESSFNLVVEDDDGVFNNGGTTEYGPVAPVGNIVTFTGVLLSDDSYFTLFGPSQGIESVVASGDWNSSSTWNCSCVPSSTDDVTIKTGHNVTLTANTTINDLEIETGATLTFNASRRFFVDGDLTVDGTISHSTGTIDFTGTGTQAFNNTSGSTITLYNLNVSGGSTVELQTGGFEVENTLKISSGQLSNVSGTATLLSSASKQCVVLSGTSNAFAGNFIVQRHISTRNASYGDLSSPVSAATLGDWDSDPSGTVTEILMSGVNGIDGNAGGFQSVFYYDEVGQAYVAVTDTTQSLDVGRGFELWLEDAASTWNAKTFDTRGTPNSGSIPVSVRTSWNLVGNPYPAWVTWTKLTKPTLNSTYYIWNTNNATYDAKTNGSIPPHQAFWVESTSNGTLTFTESSKYTSTNSTFWKEDVENEFVEVKLKVSSILNTFSHELKLRLNDMASTARDAFDASFLKSRVEEAPSITTFADNSNKELAINSFNYADEVILPIKVNVGVTGEYNIEPINFADLSAEYQFMELKDLKTGITYDLTGYSRDGINVNIDKEDDSERFELRLSNLQEGITSNEEDFVNIYKSYENTVIEFTNTDLRYNVTVYNAVGQKVIETSVSGENVFKLSNSKMATGINIINVQSIEGVVTKKLNY